MADPSLDFDREIKLPLYAEAGIVEYWIVNLVEQQLEVYRDPQPNGTYGQSMVVQPNDEIQMLLMPAARLAIVKVLP